MRRLSGSHRLLRGGGLGRVGVTGGGWRFLRRHTGSHRLLRRGGLGRAGVTGGGGRFLRRHTGSHRLLRRGGLGRVGVTGGGGRFLRRLTSRRLLRRDGLRGVGGTGGAGGRENTRQNPLLKPANAQWLRLTIHFIIASPTGTKKMIAAITRMRIKSRASRTHSACTFIVSQIASISSIITMASTRSIKMKKGMKLRRFAAHSAMPRPKEKIDRQI